jgi:hypothetical protein
MVGGRLESLADLREISQRVRSGKAGEHALCQSIFDIATRSLASGVTPSLGWAMRFGTLIDQRVNKFWFGGDSLTSLGLRWKEVIDTDGRYLPLGFHSVVTEHKN